MDRLAGHAPRLTVSPDAANPCGSLGGSLETRPGLVLAAALNGAVAAEAGGDAAVVESGGGAVVSRG